MIHELNSIPSSKHKGAPKTCRKGKDFKGREEVGKGNHCFRQSHSQKGNKEVSPVPYLTSAGMVISCWLVKGYIPGGGWNWVNLDTKSCFAAMGFFSTNDSILDLLAPFNSICHIGTGSYPSSKGKARQNTHPMPFGSFSCALAQVHLCHTSYSPF